MTAIQSLVPSSTIAGGLPALIAVSGDRAALRFLEFSPSTSAPATHGRRTPTLPPHSCAGVKSKGLANSSVFSRCNVAEYVELLEGELSAPRVKQHLACIRMLFDWLVIGQVTPSNPAHSVRGPRHSVTKGVTPVLSAEEATALLTGMDVSTVAGLRDRAIIAVMTYTFARVGTVVALAVEDYYPQKKL